MKFRKLAAGIMSAIMLSASVFALNAGADGGMFEGTTDTPKEYFSNSENAEKLFQNGEKRKALDIVKKWRDWPSYSYIYDSGEAIIHVEKKGTVELEISSLSQGINFEFLTGSMMGFGFVADAVTLDGKALDLNNYKEEDDNIILKETPVKIIYSKTWTGFYVIESVDGKEHTIKLTFNNIDAGYYMFDIRNNFGENLSEKTALKFTFPSSTKYSAATISAPKIKASAKKNKLTLSWEKVSGAEKYQICRSTDGGKTFKAVAETSGTKATIKLKKGTSYKFAVRSYKTVNGKKVYSKFSNVKSVNY